MSNKYYSFLNVTPITDQWIDTYIGPANKLVAKHGGKYLARTKSHEQLEGDDSPAQIRIIIEWPSREAALAFIKDPEYSPYLKMRTNGSKSYHYLLEAKDDLA